MDQAGATKDATTQDIANLAPGTDLTYTAATRTLASSTGADVVLPVATTTDAGLATISSTTPAALGTAAVGTGTTLARADHVHGMPSAADVGADPAGTASSAVASHVAGADPHTQYALESSLGTLATQSGTFSGTSSGTNTGDVTLAASVADVLNLSNQELQADDPGGDRLLFWDDSEGKLTHATLGPGITLVGTTIASEYVLGIACSDETSDLTDGTAKVTFRMPFAATLTAVRANVNRAPTGSTLVVDMNEEGTTVLSTKLSIDASEKTSVTAAVPAVISDSALADDAEITIDIDQVGATIKGRGLKVWLYLRRV